MDKLIKRLVIVVIFLIIFSSSQVAGIVSKSDNKPMDISINELIETISNVNNDNTKKPYSIKLDTLDQHSNKKDKVKKIGPSTDELAQSFKPTLPILTKVRLCLKYTASAEYYYYYVDIKSSLTGSALTTAYINRNIFIVGTSWYEFDFTDISVTPGTTYYIILRGVSTSGDSSSVYWWYGYPSPYANGHAWYETSNVWNYLLESTSYCDYCFETYGQSVGNNPPNTPSTPSGPTSVTEGVQYTYTTTTIDPDGDDVKYGFDFDNDGIIEPGHWTSFLTSGTVCSVKISFYGTGVRYLRAKAEDEHGAQSGFSSALVITVSGENNPPNTPSTPSGSSAGNVGVAYSYTTSTTDPDGDDISYGWDWDGDDIIDEYSSLISSGALCTASHSWSSAGTYQVKVKAKDEHNSLSAFSTPLTVIISETNDPPNKPSTPTGPASGKTGTSYTYSTSTIDADGDQVFYKWDWGDEVSDWEGPYDSGDLISTSHIWPSQGTFPVKVKAKDINDLESSWSDPLSVSIPKNKLQDIIYLRLIENRIVMQQFIKYFFHI